MYARRLQPLFRELLAEFRIVYLTGPRQAGKTTLARSISRDLGLEYVTLDDQATLASVQSDPHGFVRSLGDKRAVLDEFQYVPALIPAIKEISDRLDPHEKGKFLLTGSADIFRSARTQESLPGHMARLELLPLSVTELHGQPLNVIDHLSAGDFTNVPAASATREDIAGLVLRGGYPEVQSKSRRGRQAWFRSYMEGRLYKDFETLHAARGDYFSKLRALAPWLAGASGNLLKYSNVANDLELDDRLSKRREFRQYFDAAREKDFKCKVIQNDETAEDGHGRIEYRSYFLSTDLSTLSCVKKWNGLRALGMVESERYSGERVGIEQRYFITSPEDVESCRRAVRSH